jgi:hypothetical protein
MEGMEIVGLHRCFCLRQEITFYLILIIDIPIPPTFVTTDLLFLQEAARIVLYMKDLSCTFDTKHQKQMSALDTVRITGLPENAYYIPNFITVEEEERILRKVITYLQCIFFQTWLQADET